jgi:hypothetical protein
MATMHGDFSPEAAQRARRTIEAAGVFGDNAELIVAELADVPDEKILVALVADDLKFNGVVHVDELELVARVPELEEHHGGWVMVFSRDSSIEDVQRRAGRMAALASDRAAAIERIAARRAQSSQPDS